MGKGRNLWGGRFSGSVDPAFASFNSSFAFDRRLLAADIRASTAHANALRAAGILTDEEAQAISRGLEDILASAERDASYLDQLNSEDVHSFVESRLVEMIGDAGRKLHTGRSRNDQVATDFRLWLREAIDELLSVLKNTQVALLDIAESHRDAVMPGYTHLQRAQPVLFAHWCLAYFEMLKRDRERLTEVRTRVNVLPLGSGALAGTSFNVDREAVARELGFDSVTLNSLDGVSDRDFSVEFISACALIMVHLSRFAEEVILFSTKEFGFFELSDRVATGSSLMPQKKNPDAMELVRGKTGRVFGDLMSQLTMLKSLPLAYNKDMQEDKEATFDAFDTTGACLQMVTLVLRNITLRIDRMRDAASSGMMNATELADYLVRKGTPFREAHDLVGKIVLRAVERGLELHELSLDELREGFPAIEDDVFAALSLDQTMSSKAVVGGTASSRVLEALASARAGLLG